MATVAVSFIEVWHAGDRKEVVADVTLTGSYVSGGETLGQAELDLELELTTVDASPAAVTGGVLLTRYNHTTGKLMLFGAVDATPAANELSPELAAAAIPGGPAVVRVRATGKGTAAG